ncbi:SecDF P1 head subdomain-containing protein [Actinophytocola xinjiangensis]|uniref:SecDF P1 head subdomain-containing protein n=1 Tax=Actinophytocola xinjiangensis TaxID=485602 RepID=UPI000A8202AF|nr:hypothetical protein [Actinophytocola xinjiangensis]
MRRFWGVVVLLVALVGCSETTGGSAERTAAPTGAADLLAPIDLARVVPAPGEGTTALPDSEGQTLHVEEPFLTITRLEGATVEQQQTTWGLNITMTPEDGDVFAEWTGAHTGEQVAMIVDGQIVSAPMIQGAIPGGKVSISGQYSQSEAQALLHQITGR